MSNNRGLEPAPKKRLAKGPAFPGEPGNPGTGKPGPGGRPHLPGEKETPKPKPRFTV
jgi:hypothetical protein